MRMALVYTSSPRMDVERFAEAPQALEVETSLTRGILHVLDAVSPRLDVNTGLVSLIVDVRVSGT
eukprot:11197332-Lingulodinium_polyedra.AAC.1